METEFPVVSALARATVYRTFAVAFQPPTQAGLKSVGACDGFQTLKIAFHCLDSSVMADVNACLRRLRRDGPGLAPLAAQYAQVFGPATRGLVDPCEAEYGDGNAHEHQLQPLADISGYYLAFGFTPLASSALRQDHVACECEFMVFLNLKQALFAEECAHTAESAATLDVTRQAERTFLRDHLGRFGRPFASTLAATRNAPYYSTWGRLLSTWLDLEHARLDLDSADALPLRPECAAPTPPG